MGVGGGGGGVSADCVYYQHSVLAGAATAAAACNHFRQYGLGFGLGPAPARLTSSSSRLQSLNMTTGGGPGGALPRRISFVHTASLPNMFSLET